VSKIAVGTSLACRYFTVKVMEDDWKTRVIVEVMD